MNDQSWLYTLEKCISVKDQLDNGLRHSFPVEQVVRQLAKNLKVHSGLNILAHEQV